VAQANNSSFCLPDPAQWSGFLPRASLHFSLGPFLLYWKSSSLLEFQRYSSWKAYRSSFRGPAFSSHLGSGLHDATSVFS
jgi:hypothetical protein